MTEQQIREQIINKMRSWIGFKESNGTHKKIIDIYNSHTPRARGYMLKYTDPWCAGTVSAAAIACGLVDIMPTEVSCSKMIDLYKKIGRWKEADNYIPAPADILMYDWDDTGKGDNTGEPEHVGVVEKVVGNTITIIEGNYKNAVGRRNLEVNGRYIRGYCLPDYASKATKEVVSNVSKKVYINPGHSNVDPGAVKYETERKLNVKVADYMNAYLLENYKDVTTKVTAGSVNSTTTVCQEANKWGADLLVSIHFNAGGGDGYEALVYSSKRKDLGQIFEKHVKTIGQNSRGVKYRPDLNVLKSTNMPAILNEGAFVDNKKDIEDWNDNAELKQLGIAYAKAAAEYLKLTKKVVAPAPEVQKPVTEVIQTVTVTLPVLTKGAESDSVAALQILLNGCECQCGDVDGYFGTNTEKGLNSFKSKNRLTANGKCDAETWSKLLGM